MPNIAPPCATCQHPEAVHAQSDTFHCRVTGCACVTFRFPDEAPAPPDPDAKRLVIEIPDGFAVTVQLMPLEVTS